MLTDPRDLYEKYKEFDGKPYRTCKELDLMASSKILYQRVTAAYLRYATGLLIDDKNYKVRATLASRGVNPEYYLDDENQDVVEAAKMYLSGRRDFMPSCIADMFYKEKVHYDLKENSTPEELKETIDTLYSKKLCIRDIVSSGIGLKEVVSSNKVWESIKIDALKTAIKSDKYNQFSVYNMIVNHCIECKTAKTTIKSFKDILLPIDIVRIFDKRSKGNYSGEFFENNVDQEVEYLMVEDYVNGNSELGKFMDVVAIYGSDDSKRLLLANNKCVKTLVKNSRSKIDLDTSSTRCSNGRYRNMLEVSNKNRLNIIKNENYIPTKDDAVYIACGGKECIVETCMRGYLGVFLNDDGSIKGNYSIGNMSFNDYLLSIIKNNPKIKQVNANIIRKMRSVSTMSDTYAKDLIDAGIMPSKKDVLDAPRGMKMALIESNKMLEYLATDPDDGIRMRIAKAGKCFSVLSTDKNIDIRIASLKANDCLEEYLNGPMSINDRVKFASKGYNFERFINDDVHQVRIAAGYSRGINWTRVIDSNTSIDDIKNDAIRRAPDVLSVNSKSPVWLRRYAVYNWIDCRSFAKEEKDIGVIWAMIDMGYADEDEELHDYFKDQCRYIIDMGRYGRPVPEGMDPVAYKMISVYFNDPEKFVMYPRNDGRSLVFFVDD